MSVGKIDIGDLVKITVVWTPETPDSSLLTEQTLTVKDRKGKKTILTSTSTPAITKTAPDSFRVDFPAAVDGVNTYRWTSTPTVVAAEEGAFEVEASKVL